MIKICSQEHCRLKNSLLRSEKIGSGIPKILFLIITQKANIIPLFYPGYGKGLNVTHTHTKGSLCCHFPLRQEQWLKRDTYLPVHSSPDTLGYICKPASNTRNQAITCEVWPQYLLNVRSFQAAMFPFNNFNERIEKGRRMDFHHSRHLSDCFPLMTLWIHNSLWLQKHV